MTEKVSCLYRLYGKKTTQLIRLDDKEKVTIGRHEDNDVILTESPTVSRFHVRLTKNKQGWLIEDAGSSNGVWINGVRIEKGHFLRDRDKVEIGKDPRSDEPSVYSYEFYKQAKVKRRDEESGDSDPGPANLVKKDVPRLRRLCDEATMSTAQLRQKMMEQEERLQQEFGEKQRASDEVLKELREQLDKKSKEQAELEQRIEKQQAMERAMEEMRAQLNTKAAEQERLQKTVEEKRVEVEAQLEEKKRQQEEAQKAREELEREMVEKLKNEEEKHAAEIKTQIEALSDMLEAKEAQQQELQDQLGTLKTEVEDEKKRSVAAKQEYMTHVEDAMEDELVCSICSELLVQASSLNCSHSFCSLCIQKWMLRKKECPNCRKAITSSVQSLVLDNYINKVVGFLSKELQDRRKDMIQERKEEQRQFEAERAADVVIIDDVPVAITEVTVEQQPAHMAQLVQLVAQNQAAQTGQRTYIIPVTTPHGQRPPNVGGQAPRPQRPQNVARQAPRPQQPAARGVQNATHRANLQQLQQQAQQQMEQRLQLMRQQLTNARAPPNNANAQAQANNANARPARGQARTRGGTRGGPYTRPTNTNQQGRWAAR